MNMGVGLALGAAMGNPALGLALGAAMPDPYDTSRRRRSSYESDYDRRARLERADREQAAAVAEAKRARREETLFQRWLSLTPDNRAAYEAAEAEDRADLKAINVQRQAEHEAREAAREEAETVWRGELARQGRRRAVFCTIALVVGVITIGLGFVVGAPWLGTGFGAILGGLGLWGAIAYTPYPPEPEALNTYWRDRYFYKISLYEYEAQGFGKASEVRARAIRSMRRQRKAKA